MREENPIRGAFHGLWISGLMWLAIALIALYMTGCASPIVGGGMTGGNPVEIAPQPNGASVGVNPTMLDQIWTWCKENPKTALTAGAAAGFGAYKLAETQNWFGMGKDSGSGVNTTTTATSTHEKSWTVQTGNIGNNSTVVIYQVSPQTTSTVP